MRNRIAVISLFLAITLLWATAGVHAQPQHATESVGLAFFHECPASPYRTLSRREVTLAPSSSLLTATVTKKTTVMILIHTGNNTGSQTIRPLMPGLWPHPMGGAFAGSHFAQAIWT